MHHDPIAETCAPCGGDQLAADQAPTGWHFDRLRHAQQAEVLARANVEHAIEWRQAWGREHMLRAWRFVVLGLYLPLLAGGIAVALPYVVAFVAWGWSVVLIVLAFLLAGRFAGWVSRNEHQQRIDRERRRARRARRDVRRRRNAAVRRDFIVRGSAADMRQREAHLAEVTAKHEQVLMELWEAERGMPLHAVYPIAGFPREV